jgi:hypothetical protein
MPDGRTGWSGQYWLLDHILDASVIWTISVILLLGTLLFLVTGSLGLFSVPFRKGRWKAATLVGSILSLLFLAVTWTGILPHPTDAI